MSFLSQLWDRWRVSRPSRAIRFSLTNGPHWHLVNVTDFSKFFEALSDFAPPGAVLGLAGGAWPPALKRLLDDRAVAADEALLQTLPSDFTHARFMPVDRRNMTDLSRLASRCAEPEIAENLIVVVERIPWLEWYDAPGDPIAVTRTADEATVARFSQQAGGQHEEARHGSSR
jgi:hypothetical protein